MYICAYLKSYPVMLFYALTRHLKAFRRHMCLFLLKQTIIAANILLATKIHLYNSNLAERLKVLGRRLVVNPRL